MYFDETLNFHSPIIKPFICYMLCCLTLLHCHWFVLFCRIMWKFIQYGVAPDDEQQRTEMQEQELEADTNQSLLEKACMTYNTDFAEIFIEETKHEIKP
jgi:hypothetical protein